MKNSSRIKKFVNYNTRVYSSISNVAFKRKRAVYIMSCAAIFISGGMYIWGPRNKTVKPDNVHEHFNQVDQICIHPEVPNMIPSTLLASNKLKTFQCDKEKDWVFVKNGTLTISYSAKKKYGSVYCKYVPLLRDGDFAVREGKAVQITDDGAKLRTDFVKVSCTSQNKAKYFNYHSGIAYNASIHHRLRKIKRPRNAMGYNVLMFGYDSVSRARWIELLPKSHKYYTDSLKGIVLKGYNIVGDGTGKALSPILNGLNETELPEARRGFRNAKQVDNHPWIWKEFSKAGYATQWGEDAQHLGTFQLRLLGFAKPPVDHYMRPYFLASEPMHKYFLPFCLGSRTRHSVIMKWILDFYEMYKDIPKFSFGFHSEYSHGNYDQIALADDELLHFLKQLNNSGILDTTILILMSDHGARFQSVRSTQKGKLEERMPYFSFRFPPDFALKYPVAYKNFKTNSFRLTTPFDIHETLTSIINYKEKAIGDISNRGINLFEEVPKNRECRHAGVESHWCACLQWRKINTSRASVEAVHATIRIINSLLEPFNTECYTLKLGKVLSTYVYSVNDDLLRFKKTVDIHGRVGDMSDKMRASNPIYQVTFTTLPSNGKFEATVKHDTSNNIFTSNPQQISRINRYGDEPWCIRDFQPHLRKFCYCKKQKSV